MGGFARRGSGQVLFQGDSGGPGSPVSLVTSLFRRAFLHQLHEPAFGTRPAHEISISLKLHGKQIHRAVRSGSPRKEAVIVAHAWSRPVELDRRAAFEFCTFFSRISQVSLPTTWSTTERRPDETLANLDCRSSFPYSGAVRASQPAVGNLSQASFPVGRRRASQIVVTRVCPALDFSPPRAVRKDVYVFVGKRLCEVRHLGALLERLA